MRCDDIEMLSAYVDGELSAADAGRVRAHLAACPPCAAEADAMRAVGRLLLSAAHRPGGPADLPADVMDRLRVHVQDLVESADLTLIRMARVFSAVAASVLIAGLWLVMAHPATQARTAAAGTPGDQFAIGSLFAGPSDSADVGPTNGDYATVQPAGYASAGNGGMPANGDGSVRDGQSDRDTVLNRLLGVQEAAAPAGEAEVP